MRSRWRSSPSRAASRTAGSFNKVWRGMFGSDSPYGHFIVCQGLITPFMMYTLDRQGGRWTVLPERCEEVNDEAAILG